VLVDLFSIKPTGDAQMACGIRARHWQPRLENVANQTRFYPDRARVLDDVFHGLSPYAGIEPLSATELRALNRYGSSAKKHAAEIARKVPAVLGGRPRLVVEVGAFTGTSAAHAWAPLVEPGSGIVICVDTWLGDINMRILPSFAKVMGSEHGFPTVGRLFMRRILTLGVAQTVFALSLPSIIGARLLYLLGYQVDLVFVDSAHERGETIVELTLYWQLLRPGGVLMGDDYNIFPAVKHDVDLFARCTNVTLDLTMPNLWMLKKPIALGQ
jgi:hypothetical protein